MERGGGARCELEYPQGLSSAEREAARKKLAGMRADLAQQLLDELAASMACQVIQTTPLAYLRGLITHAVEGRFTPEGALRIADLRRRRAAVNAALNRNEAGRRGHQSVAVDAGDPLINKLLDIRGRLQDKPREPD